MSEPVLQIPNIPRLTFQTTDMPSGMPQSGIGIHRQALKFLFGYQWQPLYMQCQSVATSVPRSITHPQKPQNPFASLRSAIHRGAISRHWYSHGITDNTKHEISSNLSSVNDRL
jgi:hypothetical protein